MIKKSIAYTDFFTEEELSKDYYFHLTESELLQIIANGDLLSLERSVEDKDSARMYDLIKKLILMSYGERDDNGNFFKIKNGVKLSENFEASPAFDALMMELTSNPNIGMEFITGIMPSKVKKNLTEEDIKLLMEDPTKAKEIVEKHNN